MYSFPNLTPYRISYQSALQAWRNFLDEELPSRSAPLVSRCEALVRLGATPESLAFLWQQTKCLTNPGTYGDSPWSLAQTIGYQIAERPADMAYRDAFMQAYDSQILGKTL